MIKNIIGTIRFNNRNYNIEDFVLREPEAGILNEYLVFGPEENCWTCDFQNFNEEKNKTIFKGLRVYGKDGEIIGSCSITNWKVEHYNRVSNYQ